MYYPALLFRASLLALFSTVLFADRVETKDGSILYGKIIGTLDGNLSFETTYSQVITIPLNELVSLSSTENISVRDENNRTLTGQSIPMPKSQLNLRDCLLYTSDAADE